ncbi:HTH-type transcriptional regulator IscR [mine drainage metagenome]|uniref:HTH-type transcriptional regulator IscR n=1 Tax=mine drainage metagenome TaxID=410659 RepID=A0A1J5QSR8_9ZZZZ
MLISRTSQYAIQAMIYIGMQKEGVCAMNSEIASQIGLPPKYLAKVLQILCRGGLLVSQRGRYGGFSLREPSEDINLLKVLSIIEGREFREDCLLGLKQCEDKTACPVHQEWGAIRTEIAEMLRSQNLATFAIAVGEGKYRLTDVSLGTGRT